MTTTLLVLVTILTMTLAIACERPDSTDKTTAPLTAACLIDTYHNVKSTSGEVKESFALVKCYADPVIRAELEQLPKDADVKQCQRREQRNLPTRYPARLAQAYAAAVCIP